jgi:ketosteroid isomerase-like protein
MQWNTEQAGGKDMKRYLALCAAALIVEISVASPALPPTPASGTAVEQAVADRSRAFAQAALNGDVASFRAFMSDDYVMLWVEPASDGKKARWATMTKNEWVELLRSGKHRYRSVELLNTKVYLHGDVAIVSGDYTEAGTRDGVEYSEAGLFSETWVRRQGQWVIVGSVFP